MYDDDGNGGDVSDSGGGCGGDVNEDENNDDNDYDK
jgi:hypothetical protein